MPLFLVGTPHILQSCYFSNIVVLEGRKLNVNTAIKLSLHVGLQYF